MNKDLMFSSSKELWRENLEKKIGKVSNSEFKFASTNLNLEIQYKFKKIPSITKMLQVLLTNIEFYRKNKKLIKEDNEK